MIAWVGRLDLPGCSCWCAEVRDSFVVLPTDIWVTDDKPGGWLTLTTCTPKFSARERLIITAELVAGPNVGYISVLEGRLEELS